MFYGCVLIPSSFRFVVKSPHRSSIGLLLQKRSLGEFIRSMNKCFFEVEVTKKEWDNLSTRQKNYVDKIASLERYNAGKVFTENMLPTRRANRRAGCTIIFLR
jgi:hypothetical protein